MSICGADLPALQQVYVLRISRRRLLALSRQLLRTATPNGNADSATGLSATTANATMTVPAALHATVAATQSNATATPSVTATTVATNNINATVTTQAAVALVPQAPAAETPAQFMQRIKEHGQASLVTINVHSHCLTCHKSKLGECQCRLDYPRPSAMGPNNATESEPSPPEPVELLLHTAGKLHFPRGRPVALPPHYTAPPAGETLDRRLMRLAAPGGDFRVLEYPLYRPLVTLSQLHSSTVAPANPSAEAAPQDAADVQRLFLELLQSTIQSCCYSICASRSSMCCTLKSRFPIDVAAEVSDLMRAVFLGDYYSYDEANAVLALSNDEVRQVINAIPRDRQLDFFDYLSQQNALLGESNLAVAAALGCNFNAQPLASTESAARAMFYILDYVTKDSLKPAKLLPFIKAARERCIEYAGRAPPGENATTGTRPTRRLISVSQNGVSGSVEYASQQVALNVGGHSAHDASETFSFIFTAPLIREVRRATAIARGDNAGATVDAEVNAGWVPERCSESQRLRLALAAATLPLEATAIPDTHDEPVSDHDDDDPYAAFASDDDTEIRRPRPGTATLHRRQNNELVPTAQHIEYRHRNNALAFFVPTEYGCCIRREPVAKPKARATAQIAPDDEADEAGEDGASDDTEAEDPAPKRGRRPNARLQYDSTYDLATKFNQLLTSQQTVPIFGGLSAVPNWPDFTATHTEDTYASEARFAEWVFATLIPHPAPPRQVLLPQPELQVYAYEDAADGIVVRLDRVLSHLEGGTWRHDTVTIQTSHDAAPLTMHRFNPPPGFDSR